ncbi:hypothetical protein TWF506_006398 [Arthrobotrys conoides]|uniref:Uncharacterized protein n=1 Tax=Arthrobotrys conoides TaxID=74498 RepID=A0AAN8NGR4_9PEZI
MFWPVASNLIPLAFLALSSLVFAATPDGAGGRRISNLTLDEFPQAWNTNFTNAGQINSVVRFSNTDSKDNVSKIKIFINGTLYCLADRSVPWLLGNDRAFASLEECIQDDGRGTDHNQFWEGPGYLSTKVLPRNGSQPRLPGLGPDFTFSRMQWRRNVATRRCIFPFWGFPSAWVNPDDSHRKYSDVAKGYVALMSCDGELKPEGYGHGVYGLRDDVLDIRPKSGNPLRVTDRYSANIRLDKEYACPEPETGLANNTSRNKERYLNSLILPYLIPTSINETKFYPAVFGCAKSTQATFPSANFWTYEEGLNKIAGRVRTCERELKIQKEKWVASEEYRRAKDQWNIAERCGNNPGLDGGLNQMCIEFQNKGLPDVPRPNPDQPPSGINCDVFDTLDNNGNIVKFID